jgi:acetyl-CoA carboxylase biotin carboxyl carrier protein
LAEANDKPRPFDVRTVRDLVRLMSQHDLSEIDLTEGEQRIRLRRGSRAATMTPVVLPTAVSQAASPASLPAVSAPAASAAPAAPEKPAKKLHEIRSLAVGTFYAQREPGAPPFVTVGSRVSTSTVVCIIEAMKVYNDIQADCSGVIAEVCVNNGDFVEYNTVLFRVDPAG